MKFKLKHYRELGKMTINELSAASGVDAALISSLENGRAKVVSAGDMIRIAEALEVKVTDIFFT